MFVVIYQGTEDLCSIKVDETSIVTMGQWKVDTDADTGFVSTYTELQEALDRVNHIRKMGGEACLAAIIE